MKLIFSILSAGLLLALDSAARVDHLEACRMRQVPDSGYVHMIYTENTHTMAHLSVPWLAIAGSAAGEAWWNGTDFFKSDSTLSYGTMYHSKTQLMADTLLFMSYGAKELSKVTQTEQEEEPINEACYAPGLLINYCYLHKSQVHSEKNREFATYGMTIRKTRVQLYIRKRDNLLEKILTVSNVDPYGDVTTTTWYKDYTDVSGFYVPGRILVDKYNGHLHDTVTVLGSGITQVANPLLVRPPDYACIEEKLKIPVISVEKYNDHIHFLTLAHTNGRSMVVEFKDYLLIAEAPLNSENGELIIREARKIAPGKPIKYFIFDHHHPDYIGGIRAMIHAGATVLCTNDNIPYVQYLADAPHTLNPDSLELQPRTLQIQSTGEHSTVEDDSYKMEIYHIGMKSEHTQDYLIYYFPAEKMVFEGDLVWISEKDPVKKAGKRQAGLYNAIKDLNLDVDVIEQSWPVTGYGVKSEISFADMVQSMNVK